MPSAVKLLKMLLIWKERASPSRARSAVASAVMSRPANRIRPESGVISPVSWPMSAVLPAPLGPMSACTSPRSTVSETSSVARKAPKLLQQMGDLDERIAHCLLPPSEADTARIASPASSGCAGGASWAPTARTRKPHSPSRTNSTRSTRSGPK